MAVGGGPGPQQPEERRIAHDRAQRVQRERAALVHPVVEHAPDARVGEPQVLGLGGELGVGAGRAAGGGRLPAGLRPQPLGVRGEALVEPDVPPVGEGEAVAEPLVGQFVGDEAFAAAAAVQVVAAEDGDPVRLDGHLELLVDHDDRVLAEGVGPEELGERLHHPRLSSEVVGEVGGQARRYGGGLGQWAAEVVDQLVLADLHGRQIRRHRPRLVVHPGRRGGAHPVRLQAAVGDDRVRRGRGHRDPVARPVAEVIVAGEPGGRADRLAGDEGAVLQLLPAQLPQSRERTGLGLPT